MLLAQMPQTARVDKKSCKAPEVQLSGRSAVRSRSRRPRSQRAVNTDKDIIKVGDLYYMCFQGVWFMSQSATGPWEVTGVGAEADLRDPGQLAGVQRHLRHGRRRRRRRRRWYVRGRRRLHRHDGRPGAARCGAPATTTRRTSGTAASTRSTTRTTRPTATRAWYNPWTGAYGRGAVAYGPYGGAGVARALQPEDRNLRARRRGLGSVRRARRGAGLQPAHRRVRRRRGRARTSTAAGARPASSAAIIGPARTRDTNNVTGATTTRDAERAGARGEPSPDRPAARRRSPAEHGGDVYAGRDGNVYKKEAAAAEVRQRQLEQRAAADPRSAIRRSPRPCRAQRQYQPPDQFRAPRRRARKERSARMPPAAAAAAAAIGRAAVAEAGESSPW